MAAYEGGKRHAGVGVGRTARIRKTCVRGAAVHKFFRKESTLKIDERYVEQFIRDKVEQEGLTDAEIARLLGAGASTISHWRNKLGIKPADKFTRHFRQKYGDHAIDTFHALVENHSTLKEIADHFGFSREYARQVYNKMYSQPISSAGRQQKHAPAVLKRA